MRRPNTNQFIEVRAERLDGAPVAERRRWSDDFKVTDGVDAPRRHLCAKVEVL